MRSPTLPSVPLLAVFLAAASLAGCLQIETRVTLNADGSGTIVERLRLGRQLLDLDGGEKGQLAKCLTKESALERLKQMGQGVTLIRHELRDAEGGSKESLTEYKIGDLNDLLYASPWLAFIDYGQNSVVKFAIEPKYANGSSSGQNWAGTLMIRVQLLNRPRGVEDGRKPDAPPEIGPSPAQLQPYRDIAPMFRDMLKGFLVRLTFDSYSPVHLASVGVRNRSTNPTAVDLIHFSSENLDSWGGGFLDNQEIMLEVIRGQLAGPNIAAHVRDYERNNTLPVFLPTKSSAWWGGQYICVRPSRQLFDRYFKGKNLELRPWAKDPPVPADFDAIGWKDTKSTPTSQPESKSHP